MGGGSSHTTTTQELSPQQQQLFDLILPTITNSIGPNGVQSYDGSRVAGFTDAQVQGQNSAIDVANNFLPGYISSLTDSNRNLQNTGIGGGGDALSQILGAYDSGSAGRNFVNSPDILSPDSNPYLQATADAAIRPVQESLMQKVLPSIRSSAGAAGQPGSSRQGIAEGLAIKGFTDKAGDISSDIFSKGYGQGLNTLARSVGTTTNAASSAGNNLLGAGTRALFDAPNLANLSFMPSRVLSGVGGQQQQMNQSILSDQVDAFMSRQMLPLMLAQNIGNLAFGMPAGTTKSTGTGGSSGLEGIGTTLAAVAEILPYLGL